MLSLLDCKVYYSQTTHIYCQSLSARCGCASQPSTHCACAVDDQTGCAAYALDGQGNDISSSIQYATSNPSCTVVQAGDASCPLCAVQYMQQGLCLPGRSVSSAYSLLPRARVPTASSLTAHTHGSTHAETLYTHLAVYTERAHVSNEGDDLPGICSMPFHPICFSRAMLGYPLYVFNHIHPCFV